MRNTQTGTKIALRLFSENCRSVQGIKRKSVISSPSGRVEFAVNADGSIR